MILVYAIKRLGCERLTAYVCSADIRKGAALGPEKFPHAPHNLLKEPPASISLTPQDRRLLMSLVMHCGLGGHDAVFSGATAYRLVSDMIETGRCYLWPDGKQPLTLGDDYHAQPVWRETEHGQGLFKPDFDIADTDTGVILPTAPLLWIAPDNRTCSRLVTGMPDDLSSRWHRKPAMDLDAAAVFAREVAHAYPEATLAEPPNLKRVEIPDTIPTPVLDIDRPASTDESALLRLSLRFRYGNREIGPKQRGDTVSVVEPGRLLIMSRNRGAEAAAQAALEASGLVPYRGRATDLFGALADQDGYTLPADGELDWGHVIGTLLPQFEADGWSIRYADGCRLVEPCADDWYADFTTSARGWFTFESGIRVDGRQVNILPFIERYLKTRREWTDDRLATDLTGRAVPVPEQDCIVLVPGERLLAMIRQLFELYGDTPLDRHDRIAIDNLRAAELAVNLPGANWKPPPELVRLVAALDGALTVHPQPAPGTLAATLRAYQEQGLGWLHFLESHRLGGILADDMGLGKTMQTLALLLNAKHEGRLDLPALIVAPTSVLPNWRNEINRFAPDLRCALLHGGERHGIWDETGAYDVLLTSYGVLHRDVEHFSQRMFAFVILDEAQAIKNPKAKVSRIACSIKGRTRLCLTGTPIQNHLGELWSLMQFAMPGLLGSEAAFDRTFRKPIERDSNTVIRGILQRRVKPLILRRTKDMVEADLPPRNEIVQTVALSEVQHDLYQTVRLAMTSRIREEMETKGLARSRIVILDALLKLRQICCDPRLRDKTRNYSLPADSTKLAWLSEALPEMIDEGRRILLFSQFTSMLDLIIPLLRKLKLTYVEIRGSTRDRETPVRRFQSGEIPVFLISLKAGGTGLNLTAADTVIHYDPWWNPAVEAQATDRAHRIGQDKPVFVYKLIAEGTVEERVMQLQADKRALSTIVGQAGESGLDFSKADLDALLAPPQS